VEKIAVKIVVAGQIVEISLGGNKGVVNNEVANSVENDAGRAAIEVPTAVVIEAAIAVAAKAVVRIAAKADGPVVDRVPSTVLRRTSNWSG